MLAFDHVIVPVADLESADAVFADVHGLASVPGGRHTGLGTGNRIVPLGPDYIELMGIVDVAEASGSFLGRWLAAQLDKSETVAALCLRTDDIEAVAGRLGVQALAMTRANDDGTVLSWRLAGLEIAFTQPPLPFFIQWDVPEEMHPGRMKAPHQVRPVGIAWVELSGDRDRIEQHLGDHELDIRITEGEGAIAAVGISTDESEIVIR